MVATAIYSVTMVLWKETAFPLIIMLTPVLNSQEMKKLRYAIKNTKIKLE